MKTSDFPSVREARLTVEKHMERYKKLMGIKKGKTMIELPVTFKMLSDLQSGTIDVVRADACKAYGDQRAAEAREQMREECEIAINPHASYLGDEVIDIIKEIR